MKDNYACECGHPLDKHLTRGDLCLCLGVIPVCQCDRFKPDNLRYLEQLEKDHAYDHQ
jgi:hypothetical protein